MSLGDTIRAYAPFWRRIRLTRGHIEQWATVVDGMGRAATLQGQPQDGVPVDRQAVRAIVAEAVEQVFPVVHQERDRLLLLVQRQNKTIAKLQAVAQTERMRRDELISIMPGECLDVPYENVHRQPTIVTQVRAIEDTQDDVDAWKEQQPCPLCGEATIWVDKSLNPIDREVLVMRGCDGCQAKRVPRA